MTNLPTWYILAGLFTLLLIVFLAISGFLRGAFRKPPPILNTEYGPVTEKARYRAAMNMLEEPELRQRVEALQIEQMGGDVEAGMKEMKRKYPEVYSKP